MLLKFVIKMYMWEANSVKTLGIAYPLKLTASAFNVLFNLFYLVQNNCCCHDYK